MINPMQVYTRLCQIGEITDAEGSVLPFCVSALECVVSRLSETADEDDPLIIYTAAAVAYYDYCLKKAIEKKGMRYFKAGDVTVRSEIADEVAAAKEIRDIALMRATRIFADERFLFKGV